VTIKEATTAPKTSRVSGVGLTKNRITCSINPCYLNKNLAEGYCRSDEVKNWRSVELPVEELVIEYIQKGRAINQSLFHAGTTRCGENAFGGNLVILDLDDGFPHDQVLATPTYQRWGCFITHSASSGVVSNKPGVDGRVRLRVGFITARQFNTDRFSEDRDTLRGNQSRQHKERVIISRHINQHFCSDLGIGSIKDNCAKSVSQLFYGNDGISSISYTNGNGEDESYPCSTNRWHHVNNGLMTVMEMAQIISNYTEKNPKAFDPFPQPSVKEQEDSYNLALWIFDNDILDGEFLYERENWLAIIFAAKGISEELRDPLLTTLERFADHYWRMPDQVLRVFDDASSASNYTVGTLIKFADQSDSQWRNHCPYLHGGIVVPLEPIFQYRANRLTYQANTTS